MSIDFDASRARNPLPAYCERRGIKLRRSGVSFRGKCPIHRGNDESAFAVFDDGRWECFGQCQRGGDVTDLEQALGGGTPEEAAARLGAERRPGPLIRTPRKPKTELLPTLDNPFALPYRLNVDERRTCVEAAMRLLTTNSAIESIAHRRGWKPETIMGLALELSLGITDDGKLAFLYESGLKVRWKENGERRFGWRFGKNWLWRGGFIQQAKTIWICEGETDAISLVDRGYEADGKTAVVALPGAAFKIDPWRFLFSGKEVVLCPDNDDAGRKCLEHLIAALRPVAAAIKYLDWSTYVG